MINLLVATPLATGPPGDRVTLDDSDLHVLRLCLDLQLDALLLTVAAASNGPNGSEPPWRRWMNEDTRWACSLAADAQTGGDGPVSGLGSDLNRSVAHATETGLHARYTAMVGLLSGLSSLPSADGLEQEEQPRRWADGAARALKHYQERLAELDTHPWRQPPDRDAGDPSTGHTYLPGELLG